MTIRADFAGSSATIRAGRPEYDSTAGKMARFQRDFNGTQPGDPVKAAAVIIYIASLYEPPLRLLLGSDAVHSAEQSDSARAEADKKWRELSVSTDFNAGSSATVYPWECKVLCKEELVPHGVASGIRRPTKSAFRN